MNAIHSPGTAVFETDFLSEAKYYASKLGPSYTVTAGVDTMYAVRVRSEAQGPSSDSSPRSPTSLEETRGGFTFITKHQPPPISSRQYDWSAHLVDAAEDSPVGFGPTEFDAIRDLLIELESQ